MNPKPIKKLYYSISEVADIIGLKQYVLRYWETEFEELKPSKNRAGNRIYKEKDIRLIKQIKDLLYNKKYTIEGARNYLNRKGSSVKKVSIENDLFSTQPEAVIEEIRTELVEVLEMLESESM